MKSIATADDLEELWALPRALIFIYASWAIQARKSEAVVIGFSEAWSAVRPQCAIPVYRVDLSDQEGELWTAIRKWLQD